LTSHKEDETGYEYSSLVCINITQNTQNIRNTTTT